MEKIKILITAASFQNLTGSEIYTYELVSGLASLGFHITIYSKIGGYLFEKISEFDNVDFLDSSSKDINVKDYDLIIIQHGKSFSHLLSNETSTPIINIIHSEIIHLEDPIINVNVKKYIAIRPQIKEHIINKFNIDESMVSVIYNPIDTERFKPKEKEKNKIERIIFVGTIDYLRKAPIQDLIETTKKNNQELWVIGKFNGVDLNEFNLSENVKFLPPTKNPEHYIQQCDITAGILLGRTTIEGWMCGLPAIIYNVNNQGKILSKEFSDIPKDIDKFKKEIVIDSILQVIKKNFKSI